MITATEVCSLLESAYGSPANKPSYGPLDELVLTILSQNTSATNYTRAYANLRAQFATWDDVLSADTREVEDAIRCGGLARIKSPRIKALLQEIRDRYGKLSLDFLADMPDMEARDLLMDFNGVGIKTASCVLMFALSRPVLPVDTHVHRICQRLGLIAKSVSAEAAHGLLQEMIPDGMVYSFHVNLVAHGRRTCKALNPACDDCVLLDSCSWGQRNLTTGGM